MRKPRFLTRQRFAVWHEQQGVIVKICMRFYINKFRPLFLISVLLSFSLLLSCQAKPFSIKPALEENGEVFLYLQPLSQEAERLKFSLEAVYAQKDDGKEIPLDLSFTGIAFGKDVRQRCLATGELPPGNYRGLSFKVKDATLTTEEGAAGLSVPEKPTPVEFPFTIRRQKASLLAMTLKYRESVIEGFRFSPSFSVSVPARPPTGLSGYVSNNDAHDVAVIDKGAGEVTGMIATGTGPHGMVIDQMRGKVYVALTGDDAIDVIDSGAGDVVGRIQLRRGDNPEELALVPGNRTLLSTNAGSDTVSFIDAGSLLETERVSVGQNPVSLLIDSTGSRAYVFNTLSNTISVIDITGKTVIATLSTEPEPLRGQFNRRGDRLYVIHGRSPYLTIIDVPSLSVVRREFLGMGASSIKVDSRTDMLYIGKKFEDGVSVYDPLSFQPVDYIQTGAAVGYMTIDGDENNLYLVMPEKKSLRAVNLVSRKTVFEIDFCESPYWITVMGER